MPFSVLSPSPSLWWVLPCLAVLIGGLTGCESQEAPSSYVARVGDHHLTEVELERMLSDMGPTPDSTEARQQVIEQWVTQTLLYREALRLNLEQLDSVQRQLEEQRQSTLISTMTNRIYEEAEIAPSEEEVRTYFERHRDQLQLREPYVRVRYLSTTTSDEAAAVRQELLNQRSDLPDSTWTQIRQEYASEPATSQHISNHVMSEGRLLAQLPYEQSDLSALREGEIAPIIEQNRKYHVLQLVRRIPEGTDPELAWLEEDIRRRLRIRSRKQIYAREVQRLRTEARAEDELELP